VTATLALSGLPSERGFTIAFAASAAALAVAFCVSLLVPARRAVTRREQVAEAA